MNLFDQLITATIEAYDEFDAFSKEWLNEYAENGGTVYCSKGCFSCCDMAVDVTLPEAALIFSAITEHYRSLNLEALNKLLAVVQNSKSHAEFAHKRRSQVGFCPFLSITGSCNAHVIRPLHCRKVFSVLPGAYCADKTLLKMQLGSRLLHYVSLLSQFSVTNGQSSFVQPISQVATFVRTNLLHLTKQAIGFNLSGDMILLVELCCRSDFWKAVQTSESALVDYLKQCGLYHPFLIAVGDESST